MDYTYYIKYWLNGFWKGHNLFTAKFDSIYEINFDQLYREGAGLIVFDVDDTIAEHKGEISKRTIDLLLRLSNNGWKLGIFSNCTVERRQQLIDYFKDLNIYIFDKGGKPNPNGFIKICKENDVTPEKSVMVGEKLSTDIYGSFLAGYKYRIIVKPYTEIIGGKKSSWIGRFVRKIENIKI